MSMSTAHLPAGIPYPHAPHLVPSCSSSSSTLAEETLAAPEGLGRLAEDLVVVPELVHLRQLLVLPGRPALRPRGRRAYVVHEHLRLHAVHVAGAVRAVHGLHALVLVPVQAPHLRATHGHVVDVEEGDPRALELLDELGVVEQHPLVVLLLAVPRVHMLELVRHPRGPHELDAVALAQVHPLHHVVDVVGEQLAVRHVEALHGPLLDVVDHAVHHHVIRRAQGRHALGGIELAHEVPVQE
mmetsp:Transcript_49688/g.158669  ORF Transcript_49688/g.158669 Transcript_49688/m.158669 type:complete len:241 (+) Transcript_49688:332-1054(+)